MVTTGMATCQLLYGTTTAYGMTVPGQQGWDGQSTDYGAWPTGLTPGTTYHYQITASDGTNTYTSPDATFTVPATP